MFQDNISKTEPKHSLFSQVKDFPDFNEPAAPTEVDLEHFESDDEIYREINMVSFKKSFVHLSRHFT